VSQSDEVTAIRLAKKIFDWYLQPTEDAGVLDAIFAGQRHLRFTDWPVFFQGLFNSETFSRDRELLLRKWSPKFDRRGGITLEDAHAFFLEWYGTLDRRLFFTRPITAGRTNARRDNPTSDYPVSCYGNRTAWTLHLTLRGAVDYNVDRIITAQRGDMVLISPDAICHFGRKPDIDQWLHYWVVFQPRDEWKSLMQWQVCAHGILTLSIDEENEFLPFERLFERILELNERSTPLTERLQANLLEELLLRAALYMESMGFVPVDERVLKAMEYLAEHFQAPTSVAELANLCHLSESRLSHLFQEQFGLGVQKYRNNLRLQQAKKLLAATNEPISRIAEAVGYEDPVQFSRFFSKNIGYSPREFRASFLSF